MDRQRDFNNSNSIASESLALGAEASSIRTIPEATVQNILWRIYHQDRDRETMRPNIPSLQSALSGKWKLLSSDSQTYLEHRQSSELSDLAFETADKTISFSSDTVTIYSTLAGRIFEKNEFKLSEPILINEDVSCISYFMENALKTVYIFYVGRAEVQEEEHLTSEGNLKIVRKRGGVESIRIYEKAKDGWDLKSFHMVQLEGKIKNLEMENENLKNEVSTLQARLISLSSDAAPNQNFNGLWRNVEYKPEIFSLRLEANKFMRKWSDSNGYLVEIFGVESAHGKITRFEEGRIKQRSSEPDNSELIWFLENGYLIHLKRIPGQKEGRWIYERIGEPEEFV